ncbi:MAG: 30S ribosomal protein S6, partial [Oscillospiraceae bacterium]
MTKTSKYETIIVLDVTQGEELVKSLVEKFTTLISQNGTVESVDEWGKRRLAYEINKKREGYYVLINFQCDPSFIKELDRVYNITDGLLRTIVVNKEG